MTFLTPRRSLALTAAFVLGTATVAALQACCLPHLQDDDDDDAAAAATATANTEITGLEDNEKTTTTPEDCRRLWQEWNVQVQCALLLLERQVRARQQQQQKRSNTTITTLTNYHYAAAVAETAAETAAGAKHTDNEIARQVLAADPELRAALAELAARTHAFPGMRAGGVVPGGVDWRRMFLLDEDPVRVAVKEAAAAAVAATGKGDIRRNDVDDDGDETEKGTKTKVNLGQVLDVCFRGLLD